MIHPEKIGQTYFKVNGQNTSKNYVFQNRIFEDTPKIKIIKYFVHRIVYF